MRPIKPGPKSAQVPGSGTVVTGVLAMEQLGEPPQNAPTTAVLPLLPLAITVVIPVVSPLALSESLSIPNREVVIAPFMASRHIGSKVFVPWVWLWPSECSAILALLAHTAKATDLTLSSLLVLIA